jgi:amino acid transporter
LHARGSSTAERQPAKLQGAIRPYGYFALAFGGMVGSGWIVVLGDWLKAAGPGGAVLGLLGGGLLMTLVCACYAELAARFPQAGGEVLYALRSLGREAAFAVAWFLIFGLLAMCAFEGIALTWFVQTLVPTLTGPTLYTVMGEHITLGGVLIGLAGVMLTGTLNYLGVRLAVTFQSIVTYSFIGLSVVLIAAGFLGGRPAHLLPVFSSLEGGRSWIAGSLWVVTSCAMFLSGFQVAPYAIEERHPDTSVRSLITAMLLGVIGAAVFYCGIVLSAASAAPWTTFVGANLPAAAAFGALTRGGWLGTAVIVVATASLFKTWNCTLLAVTRLIFAQSRLGFLPPVFGKIHPRFASPSVAIVAVVLLNACGVLAGRGALLPIVNMCSTFLALIFLLVLCILYRERRRHSHTPVFAVRGGHVLIPLGIVALVGLSAVLIHEPWARAGGRVPVEWLLASAWALIGAILFGVVGRRSVHQGGEGIRPLPRSS